MNIALDGDPAHPEQLCRMLVPAATDQFSIVQLRECSQLRNEDEDHEQDMMHRPLAIGRPGRCVARFGSVIGVCSCLGRSGAWVSTLSEVNSLPTLTLLAANLEPCRLRAAPRRSCGALGAVWRVRMGSHYPAMSMIFVADLLDNPGKI